MNWLDIINEETKKDYFKWLDAFVSRERKKYNVYPPTGKVFEAFRMTPFDGVRVVIIGQDPYHSSGAAHGLAFSVLPGQPIPPSLKNIFKELGNDLGYPMPEHGCLAHWANQGVLLLNRILTVREGEALSHAGKGWEMFTTNAIKTLVEEKKGIVFILWGRAAQTIKHNIDITNHHCIISAHPSPFSANKFFGSKPFSIANTFLKRKWDIPIFWGIPS